MVAIEVTVLCPLRDESAEVVSSSVDVRELVDCALVLLGIVKDSVPNAVV